MSEFPKMTSRICSKTPSLARSKSKRKLTANSSHLTTSKKGSKPKKLLKQKILSVKCSVSKEKETSNTSGGGKHSTNSQENLSPTSAAGISVKPTELKDDNRSKNDNEITAEDLCDKHLKSEVENKTPSSSAKPEDKIPLKPLGKLSGKSENKISIKLSGKKKFKSKETSKKSKDEKKKISTNSAVNVFRANTSTRMSKLKGYKSTLRVAATEPRVPEKGELILFYDDMCPQSRSCLILFRLLNYDVELKYINLVKGEQFEESYSTINVIHTVPTLKHKDLVLTDSHSILIYICETFDGNSLTKQLYPEDRKIRYEIMNRLFFNSRILSRRHGELFTEIIRKGYSAIDSTYHENKVMESYYILNEFLSSAAYLVGETLTIADIAILSTMDALNLMYPIDLYSNVWKHLHSWFVKMHIMPNNESNNAGIEKERNIIERYGKFVFPALSSTLLLDSTGSLEILERTVQLDKKESIGCKFADGIDQLRY